jgi:hypothetical protein
MLYVMIFIQGFKMISEKEKQSRIQEAAKRALLEAEIRRYNKTEIILPKEINGCKGAEPTRFTDWERKGITYDF